MDVYINKAGNDKFAGGIDCLSGLYFNIANLSKDVKKNKNVANLVNIVGRVEHTSVFYQQFVTHWFFVLILSLFFLRSGLVYEEQYSHSNSQSIRYLIKNYAILAICNFTFHFEASINGAWMHKKDIRLCFSHPINS